MLYYCLFCLLYKMTDYNLLHRVGVSVLSLKNELSKATTVEQMTQLSDKVAGLEKQIVLKREETFRDMMKQKEQLLKQIEQLKKEINAIEMKFSSSIEWYKNQITSRIESLDSEIKNRQNEIQQ